jgi:indolepyruvate ferredoxin oxidoreductase alpha subunit
VRLTTKVAHGRESIKLPVKYQKPPAPRFKKNPSRYVMIPRFALAQHKWLVKQYQEARALVPIKVQGQGDICIVATGIAYSNACDMLKAEKLKAKIIEVKGLPFDENRLKECIKGCKKVIVLEEGKPVLEDIVGRLHSNVAGLGVRAGELGMAGVYNFLSKEFGLEFKKKEAIQLPPRPPRLCAGCPHMMSFYWLRRFPVTFPGDIGCYGLGYQWGCIDTVVCMGSSLGIGQSLPGKKIAVVGDSTFYHAGLPALINAVEQERDMVIAVLDNSTVAMTGNQPVPKLDIRIVAEALGAKTYLVDPISKKTKEVIEEALKSRGVHVIVFKRPCAKLTERKKPARITESCNNCGICDDIECPAIVREPRHINNLCNGCGFCKTICPNGAIK